MAATTIAQVMTGIETRLQTISGLRTAAYLADQVNPPQALVAVPPVPDYRETFGRGKFLLEVPVYILVGNQLDRIGQVALGGYVDITGANSIPLAIEGDRTLGGVVDDCIVGDFRPLGLDEVNAIGYIGGVFTVKCICRGV